MKTSQLINIGSEILKKNKIASHILDSEIILSKILFVYHPYYKMPPMYIPSTDTPNKTQNGLV